MAIEVVSIGSSSSGNSYIISAGKINILLDVGLTARRITGALQHCGIEPEDIDAVLVTHEHIDHVRSVRAVSRKCPNSVFYASRGTVRGAENFKYVPEERLRRVSGGDSVCIEKAGETALLEVFALSHDAAEPVGFAVTSEGEKLAVVTDTGIITGEIYDVIRDADMLVFEANHDEELLMFGDYPYRVKLRIRSDFGHMSNRYAGEMLAEILKERPDRPLSLLLAHLSDHNNIPFYASQTIETALAEAGFSPGKHYTLDIAAKDELTFFTK